MNGRKCLLLEEQMKSGLMQLRMSVHHDSVKQPVIYSTYQQLQPAKDNSATRKLKVDLEG